MKEDRNRSKSFTKSIRGKKIPNLITIIISPILFLLIYISGCRSFPAQINMTQRMETATPLQILKYTQTVIFTQILDTRPKTPTLPTNTNTPRSPIIPSTLKPIGRNKGEILFSGYWFALYKLISYYADGSGQTILREEGFLLSISWYPDGSKLIASYLGFNDDSGIVEMNADGSGFTKLELINERVDYVAWSPDGTKFAYCGQKGLFVVNADGSNATKLTDSHGCNPNWSKDSTQIICSNDMGYSGGYLIYTVDGSKEPYHKTITTIPNITLIKWSPDNKSVTYISGDLDKPDTLKLMKIMESSEQMVLAKNVIYYTWSPDGTHIALVTMLTDKTTEINVIDADGSHPMQLTNNKVYDFSPAWTPDSKLIAFISWIDEYSMRIQTIRVDGSELTTLYNLQYQTPIATPYGLYYPSLIWRP